MEQALVPGAFRASDTRIIGDEQGRDIRERGVETQTPIIERPSYIERNCTFRCHEVTWNSAARSTHARAAPPSKIFSRFALSPTMVLRRSVEPW